MDERKFKKELIHILNCHGVDNECNTPDHVLATYLMGCLREYMNLALTLDHLSEGGDE